MVQISTAPGQIAPPQAPGPPDLAATIAKYQQVEREMNTVVIQQKLLVREVMICSAAFVNLGVLGERGIAKTMAVDEFHNHMDPGDPDLDIEGIRKFYVLCSKAMPPDMLLGHLSVKQLVEHDILTYAIKDKLPSVHIAILDEGFKNNAVNLNAILSIINERTFKANGVSVKCPLWSCVLLSNLHEYQGVGGELDAFRDRFGSFLLLEGVTDSNSIRTIFDGQLARYSDPNGNHAPARTMMSLAEMTLLQDTCREIAQRANIDNAVMDAVIDLVQRAAVRGLKPSLRRYGQLWQRMAANALINGRTKIQLSDLTLAQHMLWTDIEDVNLAYELIVQHAGTGATAAVELHKALDPLVNQLNTLTANADPNTGFVSTDGMMEAARLNTSVGEVWKRYERKLREAKAASEDTSELEAVAIDIRDALTTIQKILMPQGVNP